MTERVDLDALDFGPEAQLGLIPVNLEEAAGYFRNGEYKELIDVAPALIAELRASRKVVEAAREAFDDGRNLTWQRWEVFYPIHVALAALEESVKP